jgi:hypothetical protein
MRFSWSSKIRLTIVVSSKLAIEHIAKAMRTAGIHHMLRCIDLQVSYQANTRATERFVEITTVAKKLTRLPVVISDS